MSSCSGIPLTQKIKKYLTVNNLEAVKDNYQLFSVENVSFNEHPNCCSEVDVSNYGKCLTEREVEIVLNILSMFPQSCSYVRVTTRIQSKSKRVKAPKGFKKLATTVSGHGIQYGYVHFFHKIIGDHVK